MRATKKYGYQIALREYESDPDAAKTLIKNVGKALMVLYKMDGEERLLAVFAADISGNPHYFDRGTVSSQLLTHAVCFWRAYDLPQNAYEWRECMQEVGIIPDNISSMVHAFGVKLYTEDGLHPACEAYNARKEPFVLTAENMRAITGAKAGADNVYVVENEMVFLYLVENLKETDVTLLCTSGQLRVASFQLLDHLAKSGSLIWYSGDTDPEGMDIADRLWRRYQDIFHIWRMSADDYEKAMSEEMLSDRRLAKLGRLKNPVLMSTAENMLKEKRAGYQENILEELLNDLIKEIKTGKNFLK
jgi:uncharacterized protein (TIGR02679 family)